MTVKSAPTLKEKDNSPVPEGIMAAVEKLKEMRGLPWVIGESMQSATIMYLAMEDPVKHAEDGEHHAGDQYIIMSKKEFEGKYKPIIRGDWVFIPFGKKW